MQLETNDHFLICLDMVMVKEKVQWSVGTQTEAFKCYCIRKLCAVWLTLVD